MTTYRPNMARVRANARRHGIDPSRIRPSTRKGKKLMLVDPKTGRATHFGCSRYADYTIHRDPVRRKRYLARARGMPAPRLSPNFLAQKLLW